MEIFLAVLVSYIMGSIPFGYILTKIFLKKDIREIGSGNIGATNALRTGNKSIAYLTLTLDVLKAVIPLLFIKINYPDLIHVSALSIFIGHVFPIWMKFKGGKGVATYVGILFCLSLNLGILFIFVVSIYGIFFRVLGIDLFRLKKQKSSYWLEIDNIKQSTLSKQY